MLYLVEVILGVFLLISPILLYTIQMHLKILWKMKWETKIYIFISPIMKTWHRKDEYWMRNGLYNVGYIQCYNPNFYGYEFFSSCEIEKHIYNFGKPYFERSWYLRWKNKEIRGLSFLNNLNYTLKSQSSFKYRKYIYLSHITHPMICHTFIWHLSTYLSIMK
jgi:hypothetical protein